MSNDIYIFTGGIIDEKNINIIDFNNKIIIGVDRGIDWLLNQNLIPDYFVGDFDSITDLTLEMINNKYGDRVKRFPSEKDETDTELALLLAISLRPKEVTIIGGTGSRLDHVFANINLLLKAEKEDINCIILDCNNRIQLLLPNKIKEIQESNYTYVSLLAFSDRVKGINIKGFKYPLIDSEMRIGFQYGISNELINKKGTIEINEGILLIIESKD